MADEPGPTNCRDLSPIACSRFSTAGLAADEGLTIWRESISPVFDAVPEGPTAFHAELDAYLFDDLVLGHSRASSHRFRRNRVLRKADGVDHFLIQVYLQGGAQGEHGRRPLRIRAGDLSVLDLGLETDSWAPDFDCLNLVVPRDRLLSLLAPRTTQAGS